MNASIREGPEEAKAKITAAARDTDYIIYQI